MPFYANSVVALYHIEIKTRCYQGEKTPLLDSTFAGAILKSNVGAGLAHVYLRVPMQGGSKFSVRHDE